MGNWELSDDKALPGKDKQIITHKIHKIQLVYDQLWRDCRTGSGEEFVYAVTTASDKKGTGIPSVITLCEQYLKQQMGGKYKATAKLEVSTWQRIKDLPKKKATSKDWPKTPIDVVALLDIVLLHELTHTRIALVDDIAYPSVLTCSYDSSGPGWKECVKVKDPRNAESLAFFGLAAWMLGQDPPKYVSEEGDIGDTRPAKMKRGISQFYGIVRSA